MLPRTPGDSLSQIKQMAFLVSNLSTSSQRRVRVTCKMMPTAHDLWLFPECTSAAVALGPHYCPSGSKAIALQAPNTSFFPRALKGSQDGRVVVLPLPERLTHVYVCVIFNGLGNICWCYRSLYRACSKKLPAFCQFTCTRGTLRSRNE